MDNRTQSGISRKGKLKDSCDACSASKVRCTKEKPSCARCTRLGNQCSYSVTRRMGRPYPGGRTQNQSQSQSKSQARRTHSISSKTTSQSEGLCSPQTHHHSSQSSASPAGSSYSSTEEPSLNNIFAPPLSLSPSLYDDCMGMYESGDGLSRTTDCASSLLDIMHGLSLQQLNADFLNTGPGFLNQCYKSICRILICPCSQRLEIVLLTAAACNTILDTFTAFIHESRRNSAEEETEVTMLTQGLRQLTRLMLQYTRRYGSGMESQVTCIVPGLATELKTRLQDTIDEAASLQFQLDP
ncbi:hypothetical protein GGR54DRAFT_431727 [Hypoxylon sp. NC1633]|nr:hypothetical protein GGR54DRAFT_431727 [Hypoxylon sp. NC1633]